MKSPRHILAEFGNKPDQYWHIVCLAGLMEFLTCGTLVLPWTSGCLYRDFYDMQRETRKQSVGKLQSPRLCERDMSGAIQRESPHSLHTTGTELFSTPHCDILPHSWVSHVILQLHLSVLRV